MTAAIRPLAPHLTVRRPTGSALTTGGGCCGGSGRRTLPERTAVDDLLPVCVRRGTSVTVGGVDQSGLRAHPAQGAPRNFPPTPA
ncbi:hypothetical protein [Streptomyces kronopolitis]|uniref:hypothetical protein n=1 Tax=Streptomyces kronopolitis TaxID=1612435 RepID=UPI003D958B41